MQLKRFTFLIILLSGLYATKASAQVLTQEDSLAAGLIYKQQATVLSGYGEARYSLDTKRKSAESNLKRVVLFLGHKFNNKISLFTELEVEDALSSSSGGDEGVTGRGSISMEQAFLKFNLNPSTYIVAGLFIPRIGYINENHLPTTFNGVDRPFLEEQIIPSTWREVGVGLYGQVLSVPGLNYSLALTNGLNSEGFSGANGIRGGRQLGQAANGVNLGVSGSLLYYISNFRLQASGYIGGSTALEQRVADSLQLNSGVFGNAVTLGEVNAQYNNNGISIRTIGTFVHINNADAINRAYANNSPETMYGGYAELGYDILYSRYKGERSLTLFGRYEYIDLGAKIPANGIENGANKKKYIVAGLTYKPIKGIAIKADYVERMTGDFNQALIVTPFPQQIPYFKNTGFVNLGIAYNF
ncbi:FlxA-like family protein [Mucilaginibacter gynuensis]|uniref:FlxA-like family protein n=1 Tax=Mucilaginibacter gynuensis TaxID=1302236 RepID=A0ABP8HEP7_9SPHI